MSLCNRWELGLQDLYQYMTKEGVFPWEGRAAGAVKEQEALRSPQRSPQEAN